MRLPCLILISFCLIGSAKAQSLDTLLARTARSISLYESIYPMSDGYHIDSMGLRDDEKMEIIRAGYYDETNGIVDPITIQEFYLYRVDSNIRQLFDHPDLMKEDILAKICHDCGVLQTADKRLLQISFDANTGGTYRSRITYFHYRGPQGRFSSFYDGGDQGVIGLDSDGYYTIAPLGSQGDTSYYFFTGGVRGCSYCFNSNFGILMATASGLDTKFRFDVESRGWGETVRVDFQAEQKDSIIEVLYEADDLNEGCDCSAGYDHQSFEDEYQRDGARYCYYRFRYHKFEMYIIKQTCLFHDPFADEIEEEKVWDLLR